MESRASRTSPGPETREIISLPNSISLSLQWGKRKAHSWPCLSGTIPSQFNAAGAMLGRWDPHLGKETYLQFHHFFNKTITFKALYKAVNNNMTRWAMPSAPVITICCADPGTFGWGRTTQVLGWEQFFFFSSDYWNKQQHWVKNKSKHSPALQLFSRLVLVWTLSLTNHCSTK